MPKNPLITFEITDEYIRGFLAGFESSTKAVFNEIVFNTFNSKIRPILNTRFLYHMMMGNHLIGDWSGYSDKGVLLEIANVGNIYGDMFAEQLVAFIHANDIIPVKTPSDIETKTKSGNDNRTSHFEGTNSAKNNSTSNRYDVDEIAPINSTINTINTPSNKSKMNSDTTANSNSEYTNNGGEEKEYTESENLDKSSFENSMKMVEFYLEKGNIFAVMLDCMVDKCVYETNVIF